MGERLVVNVATVDHLKRAAHYQFSSNSNQYTNMSPNEDVGRLPMKPRPQKGIIGSTTVGGKTYPP